MYIPQSHPANTPTVSISNYGRLSLNSAATKLLGNAEYVILYYDKAQKVIGLEPKEERVREALKLTPTSNSKGGFVTASGFLKKYHLIPEKTETYPVEFREDLGMLILRLGADK